VPRRRGRQQDRTSPDQPAEGGAAGDVGVSARTAWPSSPPVPPEYSALGISRRTPQTARRSTGLRAGFQPRLAAALAAAAGATPARYSTGCGPALGPARRGLDRVTCCSPKTSAPSCHRYCNGFMPCRQQVEEGISMRARASEVAAAGRPRGTRYRAAVPVAARLAVRAPVAAM